MAQFHTAWLEHQRKRFTRPDGARYLRPDASLYRSSAFWYFDVVSIPRMRHWEINAWFQSENANYNDMTPREYLVGKDWDERTRVGLEALRMFKVLKP